MRDTETDPGIAGSLRSVLHQTVDEAAAAFRSSRSIETLMALKNAVDYCFAVAMRGESTAIDPVEDARLCDPDRK